MIQKTLDKLGVGYILVTVSNSQSCVVWPAYSVLDKTKIKETFSVVVPYWIDSLKICVDNINNQ